MKNTILYLTTVVALVLLMAFLSPYEDVKIGHIDSEYVFKKIPAYQDAQKELDRIAESYRKEIESRYREIDSLYKIYQKEEVLLPKEMKIKKENEIIDKENKAKELQKKYFGKDGLLEKKRQELLKPIQDNVYNTLKKIAEAGNYDYIFDKTTGEILYARNSRDLSDNLLKQLGY